VDGLSNRLAEWEADLDLTPAAPKRTESALPVRRFRSRLTKLGPIRFLGHLDFSQGINRAFRRAGIPLVFSQGFHPLPKIAFGPPLPVGYESWAEYLDFHVGGKFQPGKALMGLNEVLPQGVEFLEIEEIPLSFPSIFDSMIHILYNIVFPEPVDLPAEKITGFGKADSFWINWSRKKKDIDLKKFVESVTLVDERTVQIRMLSSTQGTLRPEEALGYLLGWAEEQKSGPSVKKIQVGFKNSGHVRRDPD
jgi:radical SAM-linked protein